MRSKTDSILIIPNENELPSHYADQLGTAYSISVTQEHKKGKGQFFTPTPIARLMASLVTYSSTTIQLLDPGCGTAVLSCALIERLVKNNREIQKIELTAYETDLSLIPYTELSLSYLSKWLKAVNISFEFFIIQKDFILENADALIEMPQMFFSDSKKFDLIISNPPYFKLSKEDKKTKAAQTIVSGHANIYSIFMAVAAKLLKENGELIFITPRSFTSGNYFKAFRKFFFDKVQLDNIHLFVSRKDTFNRDNVLQETVIIKASRRLIINPNGEVIISSNHGLNDIDNPTTKSFPLKDLIDLNSNEKILHFPINDSEERILHIFKNWKGNLNQYNIQISTGPVVAFRALEFIQDYYENGTVFLAPLIWLHNVGKMSMAWPIDKPNKGQYIKILPESRSLLIPNKNYILLRRFSSKDDKSRLVAAPYFSNTINAELIGVENKVNYIYRPKGHLENNELVGLCALLNSELFDNYFRIFNGNVNVSASELREISLPPLDNIKYIGDKVILSDNYSVENINQIVNEQFDPDKILADG